MAGLTPTSKPSGKASSGVFDGIAKGLLLPSWLIIGFFLLLPVVMMLVYSFLTKEFRGGVIWEPSLAAYDQFIFDRGLFGDEPPVIEWTYITIFARCQHQGCLVVSDYHSVLGESVDSHSIDEVSYS